MQYAFHVPGTLLMIQYEASPVSGWVKSLRLSFLGHLARTALEEDHHRVIAATPRRPPAKWRRPVVARELPG